MQQSIADKEKIIKCDCIFDNIIEFIIFPIHIDKKNIDIDLHFA